jgi:hypothetical protein
MRRSVHNVCVRRQTHDVLTEEMPSEKTQRNHALTGQMKQVHSVAQLIGGHDQIEQTQIVGQTVANKCHATVDQIAQF